MQPTFTIRLWGVRGSVPAPGAATRQHGGNTPCISLQTAGGRDLIFDAGTGIRALGDELLREAAVPNADPVAVDLFLTHAHWDHVQGLPFFDPLYRAGTRIVIHAAEALCEAIERGVRTQMHPPSFPVRFDDVAASVSFRTVPSSGVVIDGARVTPIPASHPGGASGWRITRETGDAGGSTSSVAYLPDNEIDEASRGGDRRESWLTMLRGARLLLHDATYVPSELTRRRGWGHSSWDEAVRLAVEAEVERLVLFHHHPDRNDEAVERITDEARSLAESLGSPLRILAAAEGLVLEV